jgi:hypothetical protein
MKAKLLKKLRKKIRIEEMCGKSHEFAKQMNELNTVMGKNVESDECIIDLIEWYKKECQARPEKYGGDEIVIKAIREAALTGLTLNFSLMEAYRVLKANLAFADNM